MYNYPVSMSQCESIGMSGNCGLDCPVLKLGDCKSFDENFAEQIIDEYEVGNISQSEFEDIKENYGFDGPEEKINEKRKIILDEILK